MPSKGLSRTQKIRKDGCVGYFFAQIHSQLFNDSASNVYKEDIAPVKEWNSINCGIQYEFEFKVSDLLKMKYLREVSK